MSKRSRDISRTLKILLLDFISAALIGGVLLGIGIGILALVNIVGLGSGMVRWVIEIISSSVIIMSVGMTGYFCLFSCYQAIEDLWYSKVSSSLRVILKPGNKAEKWAIALGWWIPRKYRGAIVGDILEDCHEMRESGRREWRIRIQVIWQWAISVVTLVPIAMIAAVWRIVRLTK